MRSLRPRQFSRGLLIGLALLLPVLSACGGATPEAPVPPAPPVAAAPAAPEPAPSPAVKPVPGFAAANFRAKDVFTDQEFRLADFRGKVVFLNFWATWCGPCRVEMPAMEQLHQELGDQVVIIALGADARESPAKMAEFARSLGLTFTIAHDGAMARDAYMISGIPTSFFIDAEGVIRTRHTGTLSLEKMKQYVAEAAKPAGK